MRNIALLVIDMQVGNFSPPDPISEGIKLLSNAKKLITRARSAKNLIVYVQNNGNDGDPDVYGSPGWEIHPSIAPIEGDLVIQKKTPDAFHETNLLTELEAKRITKLVIMGLQTEYCIDTTCRRAFVLGYEVVLVEDSHSTWDSSDFTAEQIITHHNRVLGGWFATLTKERDIAF
ncbi:MAG: cysteine hydrolase family protein [Candidatus Hodarchaeales archaeon]